MTQQRTAERHSAVEWLSRAFIVLGLGIGLYLALSATTTTWAGAAPASDRVFTTTQSDGTAFRIRVFGDEFSHGTETVGGYTIVEDGGVWKYARTDVHGQLVATERVVGRDTPGRLPRHLRAHTPSRRSAPRPAPIAETNDEPAAAASSPAASDAPQPAEAATTHRNLVVLAAFTDQPAVATTAANWSGRFFGPSASLKDYYDEVSYGGFDIQPATESDGAADGIVGWLTLPMEHPYGAANDAARQHQERVAAQKAIQAADAYVDFAAYDTDDDGFLTPDELHVTVIAAGYETAYGLEDDQNGVWAHQWSFATGVVNPPVVDGVTVGDGSHGGGYTEFGEMHGNHQATLGVIAHEFGHDIGWPDLYDTDANSDATVAGVYSVMAYGSWARTPEQPYIGMSPPHPDAWSKSLQGWIEPEEIRGTVAGRALTAAAASDGSNVAVRLGDNPAGTSDWPNGPGLGEYFLVENRHPLAGTYDASLPAGGMLIWHVNETRTSNRLNTNRLVALEQADGLNELNLDMAPDVGDPGDPYPGSTTNRAFGPVTNPNSNYVSGSPSGFSVTSISNAAVTMTADFTGRPGLADLVVNHAATTGADASVTYTAVATNNGPTWAADVTIDIGLPSGLTLSGASVACTQIAPITCDVGDLGAGDTAEIHVTATASGNGEFTASADATSATTDPNALNNSMSASAVVSNWVAPQADLELTLLAQRDPAGTNFSYEATVANIGNAAAPDATVLITVPGLPLAKFRGATNGMACTGTGTLSCDAGSIGPGASKTVTITLTPGSTGPLVAEASVDTTALEAETENNTRTATADATLLCDNVPTAGNDVVLGTANAEVLCGLAGDDLLIGGGGNDLLFGGTGRDTASYVNAPAAVAVDLALQGLGTVGARPRVTGTVADGKDSFFAIERTKGSVWGDVLRGRSGTADMLWGLGGDDVLRGLSGNDTLYGGGGVDTLYGGLGTDLLYGGAKSDYCRDLIDTRVACER